ncbi:His Kinase A (phospho-acceptor) domain-containing protein [Verrucomicrobium sp. GAS474]|uniref:response regulator n=1 Tax=Verrucomicrobium sp. GAS474 TaxID=1882831 RepID=UPI00087B8D3C|nr:response regulator [Verrucomicrobium sp. GAS474]SDT86035.1 His Kinase A (phospho-acceptor) domain-containing protein [Verrucomicrobium sp. GAS474]
MNPFFAASHGLTGAGLSLVIALAILAFLLWKLRRLARDARKAEALAEANARQAEEVTRLRAEALRLASLVEGMEIQARSYEEQLRRGQWMENIGALAAGVAHDLNNALTPVLIGLQLLEDTNDEKERKALLETVDSSAQRGAAMVKQILTFVRGKRGEDGPLRLRTLIDDMAKIVRDTFPHCISIETNVEKGLWNVFGNATEMHQILLNLCVNARDAMMPVGGHLTVKAVNVILDERMVAKRQGIAPGPFVVLSVGDSGCGIPNDVIARIFEPLFTTKEPGKGTGLGLSTVIGIVKRLGGFVSVESEVGKGTQFLLHFPALSVGQSEGGSSDTLPVRSDIPLGQGKRVLFIDDDNVVRRVSKAMLEHYGYHVTTAANGVEAVSLVGSQKEGEKFDLVVSDVDMPYMDGFEVLLAIRGEEPNKPFIFISGTELDDHYLIEIKRAGLDFLPKPFTVEQLLQASARQLGLTVSPQPQSELMLEGDVRR